MTLDYLPWRRPAEYDGRPCVRDVDQELTYADFARRVDAAAEQFAELGVRPGSVVAIMLPNRVELLVAMMAAWRLGAAATPMNPTFTADEAAHQLSNSEAVLVVATEPTTVVGGPTVLPVAELRREAHGPALPVRSTDESELALLIYTSGSTGRPKGVMLSHGNLGAMADMMADSTSVDADDHCLLVLPLFHVNAILVSCLLPMTAGGQVTLLRRFHPVEFLAAIARRRPTYFSAVPTIYAYLVQAAEAGRAAGQGVDTSSVRFGICGAAPAPAGLLDQAEEVLGFPIVQGYGLSEGTCATTCNPLDGPRKPGTVGVALPGQTVAIMGPDGQLAPTGERGEVVIRGANVMQGYLHNDGATAEALGDGWLHTGDVGVLDEDGYLSIVDRIKDMIIRGGENIYPKEIETVLQEHPAVAEAAVVGAPHPVYGEVVAAFVVPTEPGAVDETALKEYCAEHLTKIKVPVSIALPAELPRNSLGKYDKPALRRQLAERAAGEQV